MTSIEDNGDGSFDITFSKSLLNYAQDAVNDGVYLLISEEGAKSVADYATSGVLVDVSAISADGLTITTDSATDPLNLNNVAYTETYEELVFEGMSLMGVDKIPLTSVTLGISDLPISFTVDNLVHEVTAEGAEGAPSVATYDVLRDAGGVISHITLDPNPLVLPYDTLIFEVSVLKGLQIDTTFPNLSQDYGGTEINYFGTAQAYGMKNLLPRGSFAVGEEYSERCTISVRRLRRFSDLSTKLNGALYNLSKIYDVRRGVVDTLVENGLEYTLTAIPVDSLGNEDVTGYDTPLGAFSDCVKEGDKVSVYHSDGSLALRLKVVSVDTDLTCTYISGALPVGDATFEIETRTGIIPQEQSFNKFLKGALTLKYEGTQGFVEAENVLKDREGVDLSTLGIEANDYILIDAYGVLNPNLNPPEYGASRRGDTGKNGTTGYVAGVINPLDDNRGVYKVLEVTSDEINVEPVYTAEGLAPAEYLLTPSLDGVESRPLRVTAEMDGSGSYLSSDASVDGFKWSVYRKKDEVGLEITDTMLFLRERTLSWAEKIRSLGGVREMTWVTYEEENLVRFLGYDDISYFSNDEIQGLIGNVGVYPLDIPFVTSNDGLSILDRRFLVESPQLLLEGYLDLGFGLPTLLEGGISFMEAREKRISWINVRVGLLRGTLPTVERVDLTNPNLKALEDIR